MALKRFNQETKPISFSDFEKDVACRIKSVGSIDMPRNRGNNRTESKKTLLRAVEKTGAIW